jgi:hypothetical protein
LKDAGMAKNNDQLIESLMQLAASAAPLIRKARESGIFRDMVVEAEVVAPAPKAAEPAPATPPQPPKPADPAPVDAGMTAALQDIVVRQALRINELEAELAAQKAATKAAGA